MNAKQVWQAALGELQLKVPGPSYQTWLRNTSIAEWKESMVAIAVPSNFAKEWLEKRFSKLIADTLNNIVGHPVEVRFEVKTPPRVAGSAHTLHALDGVSEISVPRELPMAAGQQVANPYSGSHPSMSHAAASMPTSINSARRFA